MAKVNLISQAEYAKHRKIKGLPGATEASVSKAVKGERITLIDGKIDPTIADAQWARNSRVRVGNSDAAVSPVVVSANVFPPLEDLPAVPEKKPGNEGYLSARARREVADAEKAEIALAVDKNLLIQVRAVEAVWAQRLAGVREHLLQVRARLTPMLAAESDEFKIGQLLETEHRHALALLSTGGGGAQGAPGVQGEQGGRA